MSAAQPVKTPAPSYAPMVQTRMMQARPFAMLMGVYGENYRRFRKLLGDPRKTPPSALSTGLDGVRLHLVKLETHRYTDVFGLSYRFSELEPGSQDPFAFVRLYHDAKLAEATHCEPGDRLQQLYAAKSPYFELIEHRWRMNLFINRWLEYLLDQGHGPLTFKRANSEPWRGPTYAPSEVED